MITIVGLGAERGDLTARGAEAAKAADAVVVRTRTHPSAQSLTDAGIAFESFDALYERSRSYDTLTKNIVRTLRRMGREGNVCYCVDGGVTEDRAAQLLIKQGGVTVYEGVSKAASAAARAGLFGGYTAVSAYEVAERRLALPLVVYDLDDKLLAGDVKLLLSDRFGDEAPALLLDGEKAERIPLYEADRADRYSPETALVLFDIPLLEKKRFDLDAPKVIRPKRRSSSSISRSWKRSGSISTILLPSCDACARPTAARGTGCRRTSPSASISSKRRTSLWTPSTERTPSACARRRATC